MPEEYGEISANECGFQEIDITHESYDCYCQLKTGTSIM